MTSPSGIPAAYASTAPVIDGFWTEPWIVDEAVVRSLATSIEAVITDAPASLRSLQCPGWEHDGGVLASSMEELLYFFVGIGSMVAGDAIHRVIALLDPWRNGPYTRRETYALGYRTSFRPPSSVVVRTVAADEAERRAALAWSRDAARLFTNIPPLADRAGACVELFDLHLSGPWLDPADVSSPASDLPRLWAATAPAPLLARLPELFGPIGYVAWCIARLDAVAAETAEVSATEAEPDHGSVDDEIAAQVLRFGFTELPPAVAAACDQLQPFRAKRVQRHIWDVDPSAGDDEWFERRDRELMARAGNLILEGRSDLARLDLDLRSRLSLAIAAAAHPADVWKVSTPVSNVADRVITLLRGMVAWPTPEPIPAAGDGATGPGAAAG